MMTPPLDSESLVKTSGRPHRRRQRGVATVEYSLLALPMLMMSIGAMDFGRAYFQMQVILEAAQAGARSGAMPTTTTLNVTTAVNGTLGVAGLASIATITSSGVGVNGQRGDTTTVNVSVPFVTLTGKMFSFWSGTKTLTRTARLRHE